MRQQRYYGWTPPLPDIRVQACRYRAPASVRVALPASTNLIPLCPPIQDQGAENACVANAWAGALWFQCLAQGLPNGIPSRQFIYWNARYLQNTVNLDTGCSNSLMRQAVAQFGCPPETEWPYDTPHFLPKPDPSVYGDAARFPVADVQSVTQDLDVMRGCLAAGKPFVFAISVYESSEDPEVGITGYIPLPSSGEQPISGHAMLAVGHDDGERVFRFRNSKGPNFGAGGYGTISYDYLSNPFLAGDLWVVNSVPNVPITPAPTPVPTPTAPPTVTAMTPSAGPAGTLVTITGTGFAPGCTVRFGLVYSPAVTVVSSTLLRAVAPSGPSGFVPVRVSTPMGGSPATQASLFTYGTAPPSPPPPSSPPPPPPPPPVPPAPVPDEMRLYRQGVLLADYGLTAASLPVLPGPYDEVRLLHAGSTNADFKLTPK